MNIILIAEKNHYRDWKGKTYYDILCHYKINSLNNITLIFSDEYINYSIDKIRELKPNLVCFFETDVLNISNNFDYVFELNIPIFYCGLDLFHFTKHANCYSCPNIKKCDGIIHFGKATDLENSYKLMFPNKIITHFYARFINTNRFKNYNKEKKYDILIYGSRGTHHGPGISLDTHLSDEKYRIQYESYHNKPLGEKQHFYPLRVKMELLLMKHSNKYNLKIIPNACIFNAPVANEELSQLINESHLTLACCGRSNVAFAKYFEISASYSAILGNIPTDYEDLFKHNIVEVTEWMTDEEILNIIDKALEDKEKLWEMTKRLGDRVHQECDLNAGTKNMDDVFKKIYNNK